MSEKETEREVSLTLEESGWLYHAMQQVYLDTQRAPTDGMIFTPITKAYQSRRMLRLLGKLRAANDALMREDG